VSPSRSPVLAPLDFWGGGAGGYVGKRKCVAKKGQERGGI